VPLATETGVAVRLYDDVKEVAHITGSGGEDYGVGIDVKVGDVGKGTGADIDVQVGDVGEDTGVDIDIQVGADVESGTQ